jgi:hypothetical protein
MDADGDVANMSRAIAFGGAVYLGCAAALAVAALLAARRTRTAG